MTTRSEQIGSIRVTCGEDHLQRTFLQVEMKATDVMNQWDTKGLLRFPMPSLIAFQVICAIYSREWVPVLKRLSETRILQTYLSREYPYYTLKQLLSERYTLNRLSFQGFFQSEEGHLRCLVDSYQCSLDVSDPGE
jgi:hypothetical protein